MVRGSEVALFLLTAFGSLALGVALGILSEFLLTALADLSFDSRTFAPSLSYLAAVALLGVVMALEFARRRRRKD